MNIIGNGIYTVPEAARYLHMSPQRIHSWFKSDKVGLFVSDYADPNAFTISFRDLIDVMVAGNFRRLGLRMPVIRAAYENLKVELGPHPFCHQKLYTDGKSIYTMMGEDFANAVTGQGHFGSMLKHLLKHVEYDPDTLIALRWRPRKNIVLDPDRSFGKPFVESAFVPTRALYMAYKANDCDKKFTAKLYDVKPEDVEAAVEFEQSVERKTAA